jgi:hypothetical protein
MNTRPRARGAVSLAAGLVVGAAGLAGCTGGDPPVTSTTSTSIPSTATPSSTTTSATTPTPSTTTQSAGVPDAAKQKTKAGAEAFVRYFFDAQAQAWGTPDDQLLPPLCLPSTTTCSGFQEVATDLVKAKHRFDRRPVLVDSVNALTTPSTTVVVMMTGRQVAAREVDAAGKVYYTNPVSKLELAFTLAWTADRWRIQQIQKSA